MGFGWWRTGEEMAADFACQFPARSDSDFLADCDFPNGTDVERACLAVRRSVARYGAIAPVHIYANHSYPGELEKLSGWDSIDFFGWMLELELELGAKVQSNWFDSLPRPFSVRDLAEIVYAHFDRDKKL